MTPERVIKRVRLPADAVSYWIRTAREPGGSPHGAFRRLADSLREGFWPSEAYRLGLLNDAVGAGLMQSAVSKRRMVRLQRKLNLSTWEPLLCDKSLFYAFCRAAGIPVPEVYAVLSTRSPSFHRAAGELFAGGCSAPFVVKPALGHHGEGVWIVDRAEEELLLHTGERTSPGEFARRAARESAGGAVVVQKRMTNHPSLSPVVDGAGLATVRLITLLGMQGSCEILHADFKIPRGGSMVSNLSLGMNGNLAAEVCLNSGRLLGGWTIIPGRGSVPVTRHPDTGAEFRDLQLPFWPDVRRLAVRAATALPCVRTVGWDIVLTQEGPMVLEGNMYFDPPNSTRRASLVAAALEDALRTRG